MIKIIHAFFIETHLLSNFLRAVLDKHLNSAYTIDIINAIYSTSNINIDIIYLFDINIRLLNDQYHCVK